jgi:predicted esterase
MKALRGLALIMLVLMLSTAHYALSLEVNLLKNPGFEDKNLSGWSAVDSCRLESCSRAGHSGKRALAFYPQRDGAGIARDLSTILQPGYRYAFSAWFRNAEAGWGQVDVTLGYWETGQEKQIVIGRADCDKQTWVNLANQFSIPEKADRKGLRLIARTAWGRIAFLVDDIELRPALQISIQRPAADSAPELIVRIGPHSEKRSQIQTRVNIIDNAGAPLTQFTLRPDVPCKTTLPAGYYRITAEASDLDGRAFTAGKILYSGQLQQLTQALDRQADAILAAPALAHYQGWIKYLHYMIGYCRQRDGDEGERTLQAAYRLSQWMQRIQANPALLDTLRGVQEWAYLSNVDDSGQPFKIAIPTGYDPRKAWPLVVVMHGYGGNHMEYSGGVQSNPDYFQIDILGRARGGQYTDLSEADILDAVDYVRATWRIDDRRIHPTGASMGGGATFKMASRYPDRWASGRPVCGYGVDQPILNSLHVPLYATHSQDDPTVPVLSSRAPLQMLEAAGGQVVIDETNGLQHASWNYHEGNNRALKWMYDQVRPEYSQVRHIDFIARDRYSCGAYWLKVTEWGRLPGPARFQAVAGLDNQLYMTLENIRSLQIRTSQSPFNRQQELKISINGKVPLSMAAPLPDSIFVSDSGTGWSVGSAPADAPAFALHTPGGVHNLYNREPLLIVYGTGGEAAERSAMENAAIAASKSVHPTWVGDEGDIKDGVASHQLLYGHLKVKADTAVSGTDLQRYNLVLIGRADENRLVQKMQGQLPVQFDQEIVCSDGVRLPGRAAVIGLYFYNPLAPARLIYWVAAADPASYRPYTLLLQLQDENPIGNDLLIVQDNPVCIVKARHFDSRWSWVTDLENTAKIAAIDNTFGRVFARMAESIRIATGSDYALQTVSAPQDMTAGVEGITQWADFAALDMTTPVGVMKMKGSEIHSYQQGFAKTGSSLHFYPAVDEKIDPDKIYQVAMAVSFDPLQKLINLQNRVPEAFRMLDLTVYKAMQQILF